MSSKQILILSDLHVGGSTAIWPPDFTTQGGHKLQLNELQTWLWECWNEGLAWVDKYAKKPILVLNGDLIDGMHHKSTEVMSPRTDDHVGALIELLSPLAKKAKSIYVTLGTEAHTSTAEHAIALALKAKSYRPFHAAHNSVTLRVGKVDVEIMHHISTATKPWSEATGHAAALNARRAERARVGRPAPHVIVRGHRHRFGFWNDGHGLTVTAPSWQGLTRWAYKVIPDCEFSVGFTLLDFEDPDENGLPRVRYKLFSPKPDEVYVA